MGIIDLNSDALDLSKKGFFIPPKPELLKEIQQQLDKATPDILVISELIEKDVGISAAVLKVVNSPVFALHRQVGDIKQAAVFLGIDGLATLIYGALIKRAYPQNACSINLGRFWDSSQQVANLSVVIAEKVKHKVPKEEVYTAALFQDCGIPAMALKYENYHAHLQEVNTMLTESPYALEEQRYGTSHAIIGYYIAKGWDLPPHICKHILLHNEISTLDMIDDNVEQVLFAVISMAYNIIHFLRDGTNLYYWNETKTKIFETLGCIDHDYEDFMDNAKEDLFFE